MQVYKALLYEQPRLVVVSGGTAVVLGDDDGAGVEVTHFGTVTTLSRAIIRVDDIEYRRVKK